MSKPRIGMVSQWFDPERGAAAVPGTIARSLVRQGHAVDVVTGFPNYPEGSLHSGYRLRPYQKERMAGVSVHRAPLYPSHDSHALRRAANYLSFAAAATPVALGALGQAEAVLVHSSPATAAIPALALRAVRRKPFVVHIQDLWPQTVLSSGFLDSSKARLAEKMLNHFCDTVYRHAHAIAVTSPGMARLVAQRGIDESKIVFIPNWTDESAFYPAVRDKERADRLGLRADVTVMYAGNMGEFQGLEIVVEAAGLLRHRADIGFALVGGGVEESRLRKLAAERGLSNVTFIEQQPFSEMAETLALGDIQLISLRDMPLFRTTLPSKLQATPAAGRPIVGTVTGDAARVIDDSGAGSVVEPGSPAALAEAIASMADDRSGLGARGRAGRRFYETHFSEDVASSLLSGLLTRAAGKVGSES